MKPISIIIFLLPVFIFQSCKKCSNDYPDYTIDPVTKSFFSKPGSYFIYTDTIDHVIDSQYVNYYQYSTGAFNVGGLMDGCGATGDELKMTQNSYRNGLIYDSIYLYASAPPGITYISFTGRGSQYAIAMYSADAEVPNSLTVAVTLYPEVYQFHQRWIADNGDTIPTDLYLAPNYAIIKRVEHRSTGDVSWDLVRSHIIH